MSRILGDVFQILNGNVGLGTTLPRQRFDVHDGDVVFSGNLGIGTIHPHYALDTNGDINFTGSLRQNGMIQWTVLNNHLYYTSGNVGIGTTAPIDTLHVVGNSSFTGQLLPTSCNVYDLGSSNLRWRDLYLSGTTIDLEGIRISRNEEDGGLRVHTKDGFANLVNMTLNNLISSNINVSGNIGIGTTNPLYSLDINGDINCTGNLRQNNISFVSSQWSTNGTDVYYSIGNVGIGTNDPLNYRLFVENGTSYLNKVVTSNLVLLQEPTSYFQITPVRKVYYIETASESIFNVDVTGIYGGVASNIQCFVNNNLLNYYSPSIKDYEVSYTHDTASNLTTYTITLSTPAINGSFVDITVVPQIITQTDLSNKLFVQTISVTDTYFRPYGNNIAYTYGNVGIGTTEVRQLLDVQGGNAIFNANVGIGTTLPSQLLDVQGGNAIFNANVGIGTTLPSQLLDVQGGNAIFNANIGIGTTLPKYKLDVNESIHFMGDLFKNDQLHTTLVTTSRLSTITTWGYDFGSTIPTAASSCIAIAIGGSHYLGLLRNGDVIGWGANNWGQINIPTTAQRCIAIAANNRSSLALKSDGSIIGWGHSSFVPNTINNNCIAITGKNNYFLALKNDGTIIDWGYDGYNLNIPDIASNVIAIAAGNNHSLAKKIDGSVVGWGDNSYGQINIPDDASNCIAIAAGEYHSLAIKQNGNVIGWGPSTGLPGQPSAAIVPSNASNCIAIAAGDSHSLALLSDGTVIGWGTPNYWNQATIPNQTSNSIAIAAAGVHSIALSVNENSYTYSSIGIGLTNPRQKLDIIGNAIIGGNVGIGTAIPTASLHVRPNSTTTGVVIDQVGTGSILDIRDGGINKVTIDGNGNVGIGTTNPMVSLHTIGDIRSPAFTGMVSFFAMSTVPSGWLECNGALVSRTIYVNLFNVIGTTWGAGDGSTTFKLPELRGEFLRGWDNGRGVDTSRAFASAQAAAMLDHTHSGTTGNQSADHTHTFSANANTGNNSVGHTHGVSGNTSSSGNHGHNASSADAGSHEHFSVASNSSGCVAWAPSTPYTQSGGDCGSDSKYSLSYTSSVPGNRGKTNSAGSHSHTINIGAGGDHSHSFSVNSGGISANHTHNVTVSGTSGGMSANHTHTITTGNPSVGGGTETRPRNIALLICIKF